MSVQPIVPLSGYAGWKFLQSNMAEQQARLSNDPATARDRAYFRENIGKVTSASELVGDFRLLKVALGAFGLQDDLPNRAFVEKILSDGTLAQDALSNRLADKRYRTFSQAFGFGGLTGPRTRLNSFPDEILARFDRQNFEVAVGAQDETMRLALTAAREIPEIVAAGGSDASKWFSVMGNPPLRRVFETAFGLPSATGTLDLDLQLDAFRQGADRVLGLSNFAQFQDSDLTDQLLRSFTLQTQIANGPSALTPGAAAITLLQGFA